MSRKQLITITCIFVFSLLISLAVNAQAVWADRLLSFFTSGALRIAEPSGSVWQGQGVPIINVSRLLGGSESGSSTAFQRLSTGISWEVRVDIFRAAMTLRLRSPDLRWSDSSSDITISALGIELPAGQWMWEPLRLQELGGLAGLGRISGRLKHNWSDLSIGWGGSIDLKSQGFLVNFYELSSGLTPIQPLGEYRITFESNESHVYRFSVDSSKDSVLLVQAKGQLQNGISIKGTMRCQRLCDYLSGLLSTIGRRNGEVYEFSHP
jgi:hypothetical protein